MPYLLSISSDDRDVGNYTDDFQVSFTPAMRLAGNWEMALQNATMWYSYYNISSQYGNQTFKYYNGSVWRTFNINPGLYGLTDINNVIQSYMYTQGDYTLSGSTPVFSLSLTADFNTFKCLVTLSNSYQVDFSVSNLYQILGFLPQVYSSSQEGPNNVNITNGIDKILIHVDCITGSYAQGVSSDVIYSFAVNTAPSSLIIIDPTKRVYLPINQSGYLAKLRIRITDQDNNRLNLNGEQVTLSLVLKPAR